MKRLNREINIFSLSALDLFASVMGTFILLTVILFPYYLKNAEIVEKMSTLRQELEHCQAQNAELQGQINTLQRDVQNCHEKLKQTFLAVVIKWATSKQDIDLHVIDINGNEFYFSKHNRNRSDFRNSNAELSVDTTSGPGIEIWEEPRAKPGRYRIYVKLYARNNNADNPVIKSTVYYRDGAKKLRDITLTQGGLKQLIATVEVNADGDVVVR